jgi:hypothetical protein
MRKARKNTTPHNGPFHISYDELLDNYLPKIQSAAHALGTLQDFAISVEELILAGVRGFKEAFLQVKHQSHEEAHDHCLNQIRQSMMQQLTMDR